jgi:hypothetical protein
LAHTTYALQQLRRGPPRHAGRSRIDARVHCAVLKKRTAPAPQPPQTQGNQANRPAQRKPAAPQGAGSLRTQQRAHPAPAPPARVPGPAQPARTSGRRNDHEVNSQRSTRKHGHGAGHSPAPAPGAP